MTRWVVENFSGVAPKIHPKKLAEDMAVEAVNTNFDDARLSPLLGIAQEQDLSSVNTKSLYRYNNTWLVSPNDRRYVESLLPNDTDQKIYFSDYPAYPKIQSGGATYRLGLPKPPTPVASIDNPGDPDETLAQTFFYVCAYVDAFGFEGPASAPSNMLVVGSGGSATVTFGGVPTGNYNFSSGAVLRVYRSNAGTQASAFQFLIDLPLATITHSDSALSSSLEEVLTTNDNYAAPDENAPFGALRGLIEIPGGVLAGFTNNTVHLSKVYQPHAWPYEFATQHPIVGLVPVVGGIFVATTEKPYMLVGSEPANMNIQPLLSNQACINEHSLIDMGGYAMYASPDGLCSVDAGQVEVLTKDLIDPKQWLTEYDPTTIRAFNYEGKYVALRPDGTGFSFDLAEGKNALKKYQGEPVEAAYRDPLEDKLYVIYRTELGQPELLGRWNEGAPRTFTWTSKVKQHSKSLAYTFVKVYGDQGTVDLTIYADTQTCFSGRIPTNQIIRLPLQGKASDWQFSLSAAIGVNMVGFYTSRSEII